MRINVDNFYIGLFLAIIIGLAVVISGCRDTNVVTTDGSYVGIEPKTAVVIEGK